MNPNSRRPAGRLFYLLVTTLVLAAPLRAQTSPATTLVRDTVYRADGTPAAGTLVISWPAFVTADKKTVAAGTLSVQLGADGELSVPLAPNQDSTPDGTYYKVVAKLDDGTTTTEYWNVPNLSPVTIASIRAAVLPGPPSHPTENYVLDAEIASEAAANKIPRADNSGKIAFSWLASPPGRMECTSFPGADMGEKLAACLAAASPGAWLDARGFTGEQSIASTLVIDKAITIQFPCFHATGPADAEIISIQHAGVQLLGTQFNGQPCSAFWAQTSANTHAIHITSIGDGNEDYVLRDIDTEDASFGTGSRTAGSGVQVDGGGTWLNSWGELTRVNAIGFQNGIVIVNPILTILQGLSAFNNKANGVDLSGGCTSVTILGGMAQDNGQDSWALHGCYYTTLTSTGTDRPGRDSYHIEGGGSIVLSGVGSEFPSRHGVFLGNTTGVAINAPFLLSSSADGIHAENSSFTVTGGEVRTAGGWGINPVNSWFVNTGTNITEAAPGLVGGGNVGIYPQDNVWRMPAAAVSGNVAIGTGAPSYALDIQKPGGGSTLLRVQNTGAASGDQLVTIAAGSGAAGGTHLITASVTDGATLLDVTGEAVSLPAIKATSGTRYVCIDTAGRLISSATPCSGT